MTLMVVFRWNFHANGANTAALVHFGTVELSEVSVFATAVARGR
jgi:hypothetical protein